MRKNNYPPAVQPDIEPAELQAKIEFMELISKWKFTNDPDKVRDRISWYFERCAEYQVRPTVAGLALALNVSRQTIWQWEQRGGALGDIVGQAKRLLNALLEDWSVTGKINPVAAVWLQKNHFGYRDTVQIEAVQTNNRLQADMTPEEIARIIEQDIPVDTDYGVDG